MNVAKILYFCSKKMIYPEDIKIDQELASRLSQFFTEARVERIAKATQFVVRSSSRLSGLMLLELNTFSLFNKCEQSLSEQCDYLADTFSI